MRHLLCAAFTLVSVFADGVCGPMYTADCSQFNTATTCTCEPGATVQSCSRQTALQYYTYDAASRTFMYCQWQFSPFAGAMQCGRSSTCTPSLTPALQVCQSNLQAQTSQNSDLQDQIRTLNQQLTDARLNITRLQRQFDQVNNDNQELRLELAKKGIVTLDLQSELEANMTRDLLQEFQLNQSKHIQENVTYYQRLVCGAHQGCCHYSVASIQSPLWGLCVGLLLFVFHMS